MLGYFITHVIIFLRCHFATAEISNAEIVEFYTVYDDSQLQLIKYECRCGIKRSQKKGNRYTNLISHIRAEHSTYLKEIQEDKNRITIHMPQKWILSSSVKCIFRKTRRNRILVKQSSVFIVNFDAQCNQKLRILVIERN